MVSSASLQITILNSKTCCLHFDINHLYPLTLSQTSHQSNMHFAANRWYVKFKIPTMKLQLELLCTEQMEIK